MIMQATTKKRGLVSAGLLLLLAMAAPLMAQSPIDDSENKRRLKQNISPKVGKILTEAVDIMQNSKDYSAVVTLTDEALQMRRASEYDRASTLEIRGSARMLSEPPDYRTALADFAKILRMDVFDRKRTESIVYRLAALNFQLENYDETIRYARYWIDNTQTPKSDAYYMLAGAYVQKEDFRKARPVAEKALSVLDAPKKSYYELMNYIYTQTKDVSKREKLLEKMIEVWPDNSSFWTQLAGLKSQRGKDYDAFLLLDLAYGAGLLSKQSQLVSLAQFMATYENPYRAAKLLEKEMKNGRVKKDKKNIELLSMLWMQAKENDKAIPALRQAASVGASGKLYYRLGQTLFADEKWVEAEKELSKALDYKDIDAKDKGDILLLVGSCQFNQVTEKDKTKRNKAKQSFSKALRYASSKRMANTWISYIKGIEEVEAAQERLERIQAEELRKVEEERARLAEQTRRLQGTSE